MLTKRQLKLVEILSNLETYQTVARVANCLGVSERTLHTELKIIENEGFKIERKRGLGIRLKELNKDYDISDFEIDNIKNRRIEIMKKIIFEQQSITFFGLAEEYFTSTTSIQNDIRVISKILFRDTNVNLVSDHLGTRLDKCSTEEMIKVMVNFNSFIISEMEDRNLDDNNKLVLLSEYYSRDVVFVCNSILYSFVKKNVNAISDAYIEYFLRYLIVLVYQLKNDRHITLVENSVDYFRHSFYIDSAVKILHKASLRLHFNYTNEDVQYLSLLLLNYRFEELPQEKVDNNFINDLVKQVSKAMNIDFYKDDVLLKQLHQHIPAMLSRLKYQTVVKNPFSEQIKLEYSITYNILWIILEEILPQNISKINEDENAFLTLYFQLSIEKLKKGRKILVICPTGIVTSELLINKIKTVSPSFDRIEIASISEAFELDLNSYDLILSTVKIPKKLKNLYFVSPLISDEDLKLLFNKNKSLNKKKTNFSCLKEYIKQDLIFVNETMNNRENLFQMTGKKLIEKGYVNDFFLTSLSEREILGGTDLPIGVAVPHGKTKDVRKSFITIVKLDKKIHWKDYKINLVFMIGIAQEDIHLTKQIISNIYNLISDEQILTQLRQVKTSKEVEDILYGRK